MHVVQCHPVPNARALNFRRQGIAHLGKSRLQSLQPSKLLGRGVKGNAYDGIHIGTDSKPSYMKFSSHLKIYFQVPKGKPAANLCRIRRCFAGADIACT
jgi:hypothetical protein